MRGSGVPGWSSFAARADGYPGFSKAYGLKFADQPQEMDLSLTYIALASNKVDLIAGNSTEGRIAAWILCNSSMIAITFHLTKPFTWFAKTLKTACRSLVRFGEPDQRDIHRRDATFEL